MQPLLTSSHNRKRVKVNLTDPVFIKMFQDLIKNGAVDIPNPYISRRLGQNQKIGMLHKNGQLFISKDHLHKKSVLLIPPSIKHNTHIEEKIIIIKPKYPPKTPAIMHTKNKKIHQFIFNFPL